MIPYDFAPSVFYSWLGILDDGVAMAFIYKLVGKNVSDDIKATVAETLDDWFGSEAEAKADPEVVF